MKNTQEEGSKEMMVEISEFKLISEAMPPRLVRTIAEENRKEAGFKPICYSHERSATLCLLGSGEEEA